MSLADILIKQIKSLTSDLIGAGLSDRQNFPSIRSIGGSGSQISFSGTGDVTTTLKDVPYPDAYLEIRKAGAYNISMLDGGLLQLQYLVSQEQVEKHRLAFYPSPDLSEYQNNPELYEEDEIYADVTAKNVVPAPIRFDFDRNAFEPGVHPMSHLTIGQYRNCRIPVSAPLTPYLFFNFVLSAFYNTAYIKHSQELTRFSDRLESTIHESERLHVHLIA